MSALTLDALFLVFMFIVCVGAAGYIFFPDNKNNDQDK